MDALREQIADIIHPRDFIGTRYEEPYSDYALEMADRILVIPAIAEGLLMMEAYPVSLEEMQHATKAE